VITLLSGIGIATVTFWQAVFNALWNWILQLFN